MAEVLNSANPAWLLPVVLLLLVVWFIYRRRAGGDHLQRVLKEIAFARIDGLVVPDSDEGEIQVDYLLLTSQGLLILHRIAGQQAHGLVRPGLVCASGLLIPFPEKEPVHRTADPNSLTRG